MYCRRLFLFMNANISWRREDKEKMNGVDVLLRCTDTFLTWGGDIVPLTDQWAGQGLVYVRLCPL